MNAHHRLPLTFVDTGFVFSNEKTDFNANCRKWVASFLRDVVRSHPEHVGLVVPVALFLLHDSNNNVKKVRAVVL